MLAEERGRLAAPRARAMPRSAIRGARSTARSTALARDRHGAPLLAPVRATCIDYALRLVRAAAERAKPNGDRLPGYSDSALPLLEKQLLDARPIYAVARAIADRMVAVKAREYLGADHAQTRLLLGKESPEGARRAAGRPARGSRPRGAQGVVGRRRGGDRRLDRSDDRLCAPARRQRAPPPEIVSTSRSTAR